MEQTMNKKGLFWSVVKTKIGWIIGGLSLAVLLAFLFGYLVMILWNWIMPLVFGLPEIDYWLAFGIIILARLIFGGFGNGHSNHKKSDHHNRYYSSKFKSKFRKDCGTSKWVHYDKYWAEEGEQAFNDYINRKKEIEINPAE